MSTHAERFAAWADHNYQEDGSCYATDWPPSTHELVHNVAGDVVGSRPITCRHERDASTCPYCKECGEEEAQETQADPGGIT